MTQAQVKLMRIPDHKFRSKASLAVKMRLARYFSYKQFVWHCAARRRFNRKPESKVFLNCMIYFSSRRHGDPDNIRKGIQDALYENDKYVAGKVDFFYDPTDPRVEVTITEPY
jgi:Holliday junction resolvase RusA-like endonuclease